MIKAFINSLTPPVIKKLMTTIQVRMQKKPQPEWITLQDEYFKGLQIYIDPISNLGKDYLHNHDDFIYLHLQKYNFKNSVFYDIGAHFGLHTMAFSKIAGNDGKVYAFEPHPLNTERLNKNISKNIETCDNITVIKTAITDHKGTVSFEMITDLESGWSSSSGILADDHKKTETDVKKHIQVNADTIDNLVLNNAIAKPDYIKIDVEGEEFKVIKGAEQTIRQFKPVLFIEIHTIECMYQIQKSLAEWGYKIELIHKEPDGRCFIKAETLN